MFKKFTPWLTLLAVLLCIFHFAGFDHDNTVFLLFSPITWVLPLFMDVNKINTFLLYFLTVAVWFFVGFAIDRFIMKNKSRT